MNCGLRQIGENLYVDQDSRLFTLSEGEDFDSFSFVYPNLDESSVRLDILNINTFLHQNFFTWYGRIKAIKYRTYKLFFSLRAYRLFLCSGYCFSD